MIGYRHEYWRVRNRFSPDACRRVHDKSAGVPRDIVVICGYAYTMADELGADSIGPDVIEEAATKLEMRNDREAAVAVA